jgi:hypothetical protein
MDGTDWLEYMLNQHNPSPKTLGVMNHLALCVPSVDAAYKRLLEGGMICGTNQPKIGPRWQTAIEFVRSELAAGGIDGAGFCRDAIGLAVFIKF